jgi:hypothetical protein
MQYRSSNVFSAAIGVLVLLAPALAAASPLNYLMREERFCDAEGLACIYGSLTFRVNTRLLWLNGRLKTSPGPGTLTITVKGTTRLGHVRYAPMEIPLRGRANDIVDFEMIPDHPDVYNWQIEEIRYVRK